MALDDHSAPGANAGFSYQFERAIHWLAQSPSGACVGIETDDDVAVRNPDSSQVLEQDKHSIREDATPFGDRSKDLWNTLGIWIAALDDKQVSTDNTKFLMVTNKVLPECLARKISLAEIDADIAACISALENAAKNPPKHVSPHMERVLRAASRDNLRRLISKCELIDGSQTAAGKSIRADTIGRLQLPTWSVANADSIVNELLGWLHKTALEAWQKNQAAWIRRDNFINYLHAALDQRRRQISRERAEHLIPVTDEKIGQEKARPFVKQLHLVTEDDSIVDGAIREFIRCNIEKSRLSAEGNITDDDWKSFEVALLSRWQKIRARVIRIKNTQPGRDIGFEIFTDTTEDHREKLAGSDTEQVYLTSGTYHRLADMARVGWHPDFEKLMRELGNQHD
jgi:hypothetical protein